MKKKPLTVTEEFEKMIKDLKDPEQIAKRKHKAQIEQMKEDKKKDVGL